SGGARRRAERARRARSEGKRDQTTGERRHLQRAGQGARPQDAGHASLKKDGRMTTSAVREHQSPLEAALLDVHATLAALLVASDEQYAAVVARDHAWLENVTRQQERLSSRLEQAESRRLAALDGLPLRSAIALLPADQAVRTKSLNDSIALAVNEL